MAERVLIDDVADLTQAKFALLDTLKGRDVDAIITPTERGILTGGFLRSYFGVPGITFEQALCMSNKLAMKRALRVHGLPVTGFEPLNRLADIPRLGDRLGWPVIVKPAMGAGSINTFRLDSRAAFEEAARAGRLAGLERADVQLMLEKFVPLHTEYHCDGVIEDGTATFVAVSQYFGPMLSFVGKLNGSRILEPADPAYAPLRTLHQAVVTALGLREAVTHLEVFGVEDGYVVGEVTCRPGGGGIMHTIEQQYGVRLWDAFIRTSLREPARLAPARRPGIWAWCGLPAKNGYIRRLTRADELAGLPGVAEVHMTSAAGDFLQGKQSSVFYSGIVYLRLERPQDLAGALAALQATYQIEIDQNQEPRTENHKMTR